MNYKSGRTAIIDIEANAIENPDKLWCVVLKDLETGDVRVYTDDYRDLVEVLCDYDCLVGHNILGFDWMVLGEFLGELPDVKLLDTLVLSRLAFYAIEGGHSLEEWGRRLGFPKQDFHDFAQFSEKMVEYCKNDVELTHLLYDHLMGKIGRFESAIEVEHKMALICQDIKARGFSFDIEKARNLYDEISETLTRLEKELASTFPPKTKLIREGEVKATKYGTVSKVGLSWFDGNDYSCFTPGSAYSLFKYEPFNPGSSSQVVERLNEMGWEPTEKTKGHIDCERQRPQNKQKLAQYRKTGWKISEKNLATLPEDAPQEAQSLVQYILLKSRLSTLEEWFKAYSPLTGAIHGTINSIGTWPHRVSHRAPNMGNIPTEKSIKYNEEKHRSLALKYGREMRSCWKARPGYVQIGTDISSAHLRILAHLSNDPKMVAAVLGDTHTENQKALGPVCRDRDQAKTFIYSFINGAGISKVAEILNCSHRDAKQALTNFDDYYPGFKEFKESQIKKDIERGFIYALDGRPIVFPRPNTVIAAYLLSGEACISKYANVKWQEELRKDHIPFYQLNYIHDEWQTETYDEEGLGEYVGQVQVDSIRWAGELFEMTCPMDGQYKLGYNWYETH